MYVYEYVFCKCTDFPHSFDYLLLILQPLVQIRISRESLFRLTRSEYISLQYGLKAEVHNGHHSLA